MRQRDIQLQQPEQPGLLTAIPDSLLPSPHVSLPSVVALIPYSEPQSPLHQAQAKAFIPKLVKDWCHVTAECSKVEKYGRETKT